MLDTIKNSWKQLEPRERLILGWGGVIVALILFYAFVWQPWHKSINSMQDSIQTMRSDLVWVRQHGEILSNGGKGLEKKVKGAKQSLLSVIETTAKKHKVRKSIQQMVPSNNDSQVRVVLEDVNFNNWIKWVDILANQYGVNTLDVNAERSSGKPNIAEITVSFER